MTTLSVVDYVLFALMLCISGAIGVYHVIRNKNEEGQSFLLANQNISLIPIAISLFVTFLSAIGILGFTGEVYTFGFSYILLCLAYICVFFISTFLYIPVFYKLKVISTNEYLEKRFTLGIRLMGSILFIITCTFYLAIGLFAPALAMDAVSDLPIVVSVVVTGFVCIFYTSLGGFRAVVWADVFQGFVIVVGMIAIFITGLLEVGGFRNVWRINKEMKRLEVFNFDPDPTTRTTFWTLFVGGTFALLFPWSVSQLSVQRFLASKSLKCAKQAMFICTAATVIFTAFCCINGLIIFAVYHNCDPARNKQIATNDQILPYFVVDKLGHLTGVPGLFISALFSGALSTISSGINSVTAVILEDIVKKVNKNISDFRATRISRIISAVYGIVVILGAICLVYSNAPLLVQLTGSLIGITAGPLLGLFTLGMLSKKATWKGAYIGTVSSLIFVGWIYVGSIYYPSISERLPVSIDGCDVGNVFNGTNGLRNKISPFKNMTVSYRNPMAKFYGLSFFYYGAVGLFVTIIIGYVFSVILAIWDEEQVVVDDDLLFEFHNLFKRKTEKTIPREYEESLVKTSRL